jgi:cyclophilin family peptidyl-prolyl cis-trans isomerase
VPSEKRARQRAARSAKLEAIAQQEKRRRLIRNGILIGVVAVVVLGGAYLLFGRNSKKNPTTASTSTTTTSAAPGSTVTTIAQNQVSGAQDAANAGAITAGCPASPSDRANSLHWSSAPAMAIDPSKTYTAVVKTTLGNFTITLDAKSAPQTVNNFVYLAQQGFYKCVIFHRVIPNFMNQTGDPTGTGQGGPGYTIPDENPPKAANSADQYPVGSVAMANTGQPHSGGSQWFVVTGSEGSSLPNTYALFGNVTSGMDVVNKINGEGNPSAQSNGVPPLVTQRILSVTVSSS